MLAPNWDFTIFSLMWPKDKNNQEKENHFSLCSTDLKTLKIYSTCPALSLQNKLFLLWERQYCFKIEFYLKVEHDACVVALLCCPLTLSMSRELSLTVITIEHVHAVSVTVLMLSTCHFRQMWFPSGVIAR